MLIAKDSWASIEEMEEVIPFHIKSFRTVIEKCQGEQTEPSKSDLVFCVRFISTLLFLRVKCTRPMTFKFLTLSMVEKAKLNGGFIEQTEFKTASKYLFDTLILSEDVLEIIDLYILHVRPRLNPICNYLLLSTNGTQFQSITTAMTMIVHQAIGKYINPTRYRQIIETESSDKLSLEEQRYISEDQKHSSKVAKIFYKKKESQKVAVEGKKCIEKMVNRDESNKNLMEMFNCIETHFDSSVLDKSLHILSEGETSCYKQQLYTENNDPYQPLNESTDLTITSSIINDEILPKPLTIPNDDIKIKRETAKHELRRQGKNTKFTIEEDHYLLKGIKKYGRKSWAMILKDTSFRFHPSRNRDSLRVRADSTAFKKYFKESL